MAERLQVYKCAKCGNIVEILHGGVGTLVCCDESMQLLQEGVTDAATEKHVPVIEKAPGEVRVKVGEVAHPMAREALVLGHGLLVAREALQPLVLHPAAVMLVEENGPAQVHLGAAEPDHLPIQHGRRAGPRRQRQAALRVGPLLGVPIPRHGIGVAPDAEARQRSAS